MIWDKNKSDASNVQALERAMQDAPIFGVTFREAAQGMEMLARAFRLSRYPAFPEAERNECQLVPYDQLG